MYKDYMNENVESSLLNFVQSRNIPSKQHESNFISLLKLVQVFCKEERLQQERGKLFRYEKNTFTSTSYIKPKKDNKK